MAIRFTEKAPVPLRPQPSETPRSDEAARAAGEARFATPIEAVPPVNPDASGELPFGDLPRAEKAERKKRASKPVDRK